MSGGYLVENSGLVLALVQQEALYVYPIDLTWFANKPYAGTADRS
jgi:hypothetical protein